MRTLFEMGFRNTFQPLLGQEMITSWEQLQNQPSSGGVPGAITSYDQMMNQPSTPSTPSTPSGGGSSTDWGKLVAQGITAAGQGYGTYSKEQIAKIQAEAQAKGKLPTPAPMIAPSTGGVSSNTVLIIGGIAVVGLIAAVALRG
jgi:hypothetical protein